MDEIPHLQRIHRHFPDLPLKQVELNREGLVNDVVIVNGEWVFRFAKHDWAKQALAQEARVLELVRPRVSVAVPDFEMIEADWVRYRWLPGVPLLRDELLRQSEAIQEALAEQVASLMRHMHSIPISEVQTAGVGASETVRIREDWLKLYEDVQQELFSIMMAHTRAWVHRHFEPILRDDGFLAHTPVLMDGDLAPYHFLYDPAQKKLTGKIDFGTAGLGDPACDVACVMYHYGESFLRRMVRFYPGINALLDRARFWAGTLELQWTLSGVRTKDFSWFTAHLGGARDVRPFNWQPLS